MLMMVITVPGEAHCSMRWEYVSPDRQSSSCCNNGSQSLPHRASSTWSPPSDSVWEPWEPHHPLQCHSNQPPLASSQLLPSKSSWPSDIWHTQIFTWFWTQSHKVLKQEPGWAESVGKPEMTAEHSKNAKQVKSLAGLVISWSVNWLTER